MKHDSESNARAAEFARRLRLTGLRLTEFQKRSGLTRNVIYNLSKGQKPSSSEQAAHLERAFAELENKS